MKIDLIMVLMRSYFHAGMITGYGCRLPSVVVTIEELNSGHNESSTTKEVSATIFFTHGGLIRGR
jgi:hypothetical protein